MWPTWPQVGFQNRAKIDKKSMQKSIEKSMPFEIDFWRDLGGFWEGKWRQVGTKFYQKSMSSAKSDFLKNRALAAAGARFLRFWGSKSGVKIDQKSIKKGVQHGKASWHRFLNDFGRFWEASWARKSIQNRSKKASKKWWEAILEAILGAFWNPLGALKSTGRAGPAATRARWRVRRAPSLGFQDY